MALNYSSKRKMTMTECDFPYYYNWIKRKKTESINKIALNK